MSEGIRTLFALHRPPGVTGRGDKYLADHAQNLRRHLARTQTKFKHPTAQLPVDQLDELAIALVEFAEDIHNDIGLWRSLETYNQEFFGTPLPSHVYNGELNFQTGFAPDRLMHLVWGLWRCFKPDHIVSPTHQDLRWLSDVASLYLTEHFPRLPKDSGVKNFLATANDYGWEIKRKLIWLGTHSYLFRHIFQRYLENQNERPSDIGTTDDFICQECTLWSGLGVIDILASALVIGEADRATLRNWYERHAAFYRIRSRQDKAGQTEFLDALNLINEQPYRIRMNMPNCPFQSGEVVFGSLTPWRGEWYWSGEAQQWGELTAEAVAGIQKEFLHRQSGICYRYCPALAEKARERNRLYHAEFVAEYGSDFVVFSNGLSLAAAEQRRLTAPFQAASPETVRRIMEEHQLAHPRPRMS